MDTPRALIAVDVSGGELTLAVFEAATLRPVGKARSVPLALLVPEQGQRDAAAACAAVVESRD